MSRKRIVAGAALAAMLFVQGCLRYEVIGPKKPKQLVSIQSFDFKKRLPIADKLPLPLSLQKKQKPELRFKTLESEYRSGDLLWLNSKER